MRRSPLLALAALFALVALPTRIVLAQDSTATPPPEKPTADYITREQLTEPKFSTLYDLIEATHNNWLRERIPSPGDRTATGNRADTTGRAQYTNDYNAGKSQAGSNGGIQVYIDGTRAGGLDQLKQVRPNELWSVRRINGIDAQGRFGIGHGAGVIYVVTLGSKGRTP